MAGKNMTIYFTEESLADFEKIKTHLKITYGAMPTWMKAGRISMNGMTFKFALAKTVEMIEKNMGGV